MNEKYMTFGDYIKKKRQADPRELTMVDVAKHLGISPSYVSEVENRRKRAFDGETLEKLAKFLNLTEAETAKMYDLAGRENRDVPYDIEDTFMYEEVGELARYALRQSKKGIFKEEDWKTFIRETEEKNKKQQTQE